LAVSGNLSGDYLLAVDDIMWT